MSDCRLATVGSRTFDDYVLLCEQVWDYVNELWPNQLFEIVTGDNKGTKKTRGADKLAVKYADDHGLDYTVHKARWDLYGKKAGPLRNQEVVNDSTAGLVFWDGETSGTKDVVERLDRKRLPYRIVYPDGSHQQQDILF